MAYLLRIAVVTSLLIYSCLSFGQPGPKLMRDGQVIDFDPQYIQPVDNSTRTAIMSQVQNTIQQAMARGVNSVGHLSLAQLLTEERNVKLFLVDKEVSALGIGRFTIHDSHRQCLFERNKVRISEPKYPRQQGIERSTFVAS